MALFEANGLTGSLFADSEIAETLSDRRWLEAMLNFEADLARAEAKVGVIPSAAAEHIAACCDVNLYEIAEIGRRATLAGNAAIPMVAMLTAQVAQRNAAAAEFVHYGATSQDVIDSGLVCVIDGAQELILKRIGRCCEALATLADTHRKTVMPGRTLLQHALPISFGLKCAQWLDALLQSHEVLTQRSAPSLQFGGAVGNLSALGDKGTRVIEALRESGLAHRRVPWHTNRSQLQLVASHLGILTSTLGKIARDISLLMQTEVAEVFEPSLPGKGGSSTLPHKRNPVQSVAIIAIAMRTPALVATMLSAGMQEHERGVGGWHAEWDTLRALLQLTGAAALHMQTLLDGIEVDAVRMRANLELSNGLMMAERVTFALAPSMGRSKAKAFMETACKQAMLDKQHLKGHLLTKPEVAALDLDALFDPSTYLGASDNFIDSLIARFKPQQQASNQTRKDAS